MTRLRAFICVLVFCGILAAFSRDTEEVKNGGVSGVIASQRTAAKWGIQVTDATGFWTPTSQEVAAAESHLRVALEQGVKDPATIMPGPFSDSSRKYQSGQIANVLQHYDTCQRQYVGVMVKGKRYLLLNSFPARESMREREGFVMVNDGGYNYWRVLYSIDEKTFSRMSVNGYA